MTEERTLWGIHMSRDFGTSPIDQGFVGIGWSSIGDLSRLPATREAFKNAVAKSFPSMKPGAVPVAAGTLFKFAVEMQPGDRVIYPSKIDRMVNLGVIEGEYRFDASLPDEPCPNRRSVRWLQQFARAEFSQNALHEIGSAVTLFQVRNNADEFLAAFGGKPIESADLDEQTADEAAVNTQEATEDFIIKRLKSGLTPYQFEKFIAHLLERTGLHARVTQESGDGGVDIIAHKDELGFEGPIIKVQCKQTLTSIGRPEVAQLYGHIDPNKEHALFVTLGEYTAQARQFERAKQGLRLITGKDLVNMISHHYERFEPRYQMLLPMKKVYIPTVVSGEGNYD